MDIWGVPLPYATSIGAGWVTAVGLASYVLRALLTGKIVPGATHTEIVERLTKNGDGWREAYDGMAKVNADNVLQNAQWAETSRIIRDYIAAQDRANEIEEALRADRRGDKT